MVRSINDIHNLQTCDCHLCVQELAFYRKHEIEPPKTWKPLREAPRRVDQIFTNYRALISGLTSGPVCRRAWRLARRDRHFFSKMYCRVSVTDRRQILSLSATDTFFPKMYCRVSVTDRRQILASGGDIDLKILSVVCMAAYLNRLVSRVKY